MAEGKLWLEQSLLASSGWSALRTEHLSRAGGVVFQSAAGTTAEHTRQQPQALTEEMTLLTSEQIWCLVDIDAQYMCHRPGTQVTQTRQGHTTHEAFA